MQVTHLSLKLYLDGLDGPLMQRFMHERLSGHANGNLHSLADSDIDSIQWTETLLSGFGFDKGAGRMSAQCQSPSRGFIRVEI